MNNNVELFKEVLQSHGIRYSILCEQLDSAVFSVACQSQINTVQFRVSGGGSVYVSSVLGTVAAEQECHVLKELNALMLKNDYLQLTLQGKQIVCKYTFAIPWGVENESRGFVSVHIAMIMSLFDWATHNTFFLWRETYE